MDGDAVAGPGGRRSVQVGAALLVAAAVLLVVVSRWGDSEGRGFPEEGSVEVGFARDMKSHHAQAVEMATIIGDRTEDEILQSLALDIALTQQAQIGWMSGWLDLWDVPQGSPGVRMAWMDHPMKGRMPGMASREEVAALRTDSTSEAEQAFLRLMIDHHQAGVDMAEAAVQRATQPDARFFAEKMATGQRAEIDTLRDMLAQRGGANPADEGHDNAPGADSGPSDTHAGTVSPP